MNVKFAVRHFGPKLLPLNFADCRPLLLIQMDFTQLRHRLQFRQSTSSNGSVIQPQNLQIRQNGHVLQPDISDFCRTNMQVRQLPQPNNVRQPFVSNSRSPQIYGPFGKKCPIHKLNNSATQHLKNIPRISAGRLAIDCNLRLASSFSSSLFFA